MSDSEVQKYRLCAGKVLLKGILPTALPFIGATLAFFYYFHSNLFESSDHKSLLKCLPILLLALIVLLRGASSCYKYLVFIGLVLSAVGDYFLVQPDKFLEGTAAFGCAHIFYVFAFGFSPLGLLSMIASGAMVAVVSHHLVPKVPEDLKIAVPCYIGLIACMLWRSLARLSHPRANWTHWAGALGAVLFVSSDMTLSFNEWYLEERCPHAELITMVTYYGGQLGIALSAMDRNGMAAKEIERLAKKD